MDSTESVSDASFSYESKIQERDGEKVFTYEIPRAFHGHAFAMDLEWGDGSGQVQGPWTVAFVLGTDFCIHEARASNIHPEKGYSYLTIGDELSPSQRVTVSYARPGAEAPEKNATLTIGCAGDRVERFSVEVPELELQAALAMASRVVNGILDLVSYRLALPIQIRHIEVRPSASGSNYMRRYVTAPYAAAPLKRSDFTIAHRIPKLLAPAVRLYREAVSSSRPHYRLLCLYRVREAILRAQSANNKALLSQGVTPSRPVRVVPDTELTREFFSGLIGKKVGAFLEHVRKEFRIPIAHLKLDDYDKMILDPTDVRIDHKVDYTNAVLLTVVRRLIQDEAELMSKQGLE